MFEFLYGFCLVPYLEVRLQGINFNSPARSQPATDKSNRIFGNQLSNTLLKGILIHNSKRYYFKNSYIERIDKFFDVVFVDECQDFASYDFDWLLSLAKLDAEVYLLGDFYQKTFATSRSGNKGKGVHSDFSRWIGSMQKAVFSIDNSNLLESRRCPKKVCNFISEKLAIDITCPPDASEGRIIELESPSDIEAIMNDDSVMKLFYRNSSKYSCRSQNWGESKGREFHKVCVVLNTTTFDNYKKDTLKNCLLKLNLNSMLHALEPHRTYISSLNLRL